MKKKVLIICGPTATGKTSLAIELSKKFNGEIVSADSRQVYKGLDIGTGKEKSENVPIHGYDLVNADEKFNVSMFNKFANDTILHLVKKGILPIVVGGTGFYIKALIDGIETLDVPVNNLLRKALNELPVEELFEKLAVVDPSKAASLNYSDKKNPRRLIRAIEIANWMINNPRKNKNRKGNYFDILSIGLNTDKFLLDERIARRVEDRMNEGFVYEMENLLKKGIGWNYQSMESLGYKESEQFLKKGLSYEEFLLLWSRNEQKYAKRQLTWFKKDKRIIWFDINAPGFFENVETLVRKWYSMSSND